MNTKLNLADEVLVELAIKGDQKAYSALVKKYTPVLIQLGRRMAFNQEEMDDILQDIFVKTFHGLSKFQNRSSFFTWIYRIALNHYISQKRKRKIATVPIVEDELMIREEADTKDAAMSYFTGLLICLDEEQRETLLLSDILNFNHNPASEYLDINQSAYRKRLSRARADLKNWREKRCSLTSGEGTCACIFKKKKWEGEGLINKQTGRFETDYILGVEKIVKERFGS
jgi:RNA polymerase sigma factor (sigma-70 family)